VDQSLSELIEKIVTAETAFSAQVRSSSEGVQLLQQVAQLRSEISPRLDSAIVSDFPSIFEQFRGKCFTLLWRESAHGRGAGHFHARCDGHLNTLTIIKDTNGYIFGGFTPLAWDSTSEYKCDSSLTSFVFTLRNPHGAPARTFRLLPSGSGCAIYCISTRGPCFGGGQDIAVHVSNAASSTNFGNSYYNDTGRRGRTFFTGSYNFAVEDIEVFEITT
jgi:hypothetical protein